MKIKLFESSVFQFSILILSTSALAAGFTEDLSWKDWLSEAIIILGIFATKEGVKYGAEAYEGVNTYE